jgi:hypothetical protein
MRASAPQVLPAGARRHSSAATSAARTLLPCRPWGRRVSSMPSRMPMVVPGAKRCHARLPEGDVAPTPTDRSDDRDRRAGVRASGLCRQQRSERQRRRRGESKSYIPHVASLSARHGTNTIQIPVKTGHKSITLHQVSALGGHPILQCKTTLATELRPARAARLAREKISARYGLDATSSHRPRPCIRARATAFSLERTGPQLLMGTTRMT